MSPGKPTIFFSHSSRDAGVLAKLREKFVEKTGGSIDVFLSSDGQSIPLGRNWVSEVEDALKRARLMFVFLSAASLKSPWVHFESGFAYARGLRVVPVGIAGVDVAAAGPPLSLLQGFNVGTPASLANVITVANREFGHTHNASITQQEYDSLFAESPDSPAGLIEEVQIWCSREDLALSGQEALAVVAALAREAQVEAVCAGSICRGPGFFARNDGNGLHLEVDQSCLTARIELIDTVLQRVRKGGAVGLVLRVNLEPSVVALVVDSHRVSGRLVDKGVRVSGTLDRCAFGDLEFEVERRPLTYSGGVVGSGTRLEVSPTSAHISAASLGQLVTVLLEGGVLGFADQ